MLSKSTVSRCLALIISVMLPGLVGSRAVAQAPGSTGTCTITQEPQSHTQCSGAGPFTITARIDLGAVWALRKFPEDGTPSFIYALGPGTGSTTASYTFNGITIGDSGLYQFEFTRVLFPNCFTLTQPFRVTINPAGPVHASPLNAQSPVSCLGSTTTLTAACTSQASGVTYRWTKNGTNMSDGGRISGAQGNGTSSTLTITDTASGDAAIYVCTWSSPLCGQTDQSPTFTLGVNGEVVVDGQPTSYHSCVGGPLFASCSGYYPIYPVGTGTVTYQWQKRNANNNWTNLSGQTASFLEFTSAAATDAGAYRCRLSGAGCGAVFTDVIDFTLGPPTIAAQPEPVSGCIGSAVSLSCAAGSTIATTEYRWQKKTGNLWGSLSNGGGVSGARSATLTLSNIDSSDGAEYRCNITNPATVTGCVLENTATTDPVQVTVYLAAPTITSGPDSAQGCVGSPLTLSVVSPDAVSYQWRKGNNNINGATGPSYTITSFDGSQTGNYTCRVTNTCGTTTSAVAVVSNYVGPVITVQPVDEIRCTTGSASFSVAATGVAPLTYQWKFNGNNLVNGTFGAGLRITGANSANLGLSYILASEAGNYTCLVTDANGCTGTLSQPATLYIDALVITQQPVAQTVCAGADVTLSVGVTPTPFRYRWYKDNVQLDNTTVSNGSWATATLLLPSAGAGRSGSYRCDVTNTCDRVVSSSTVVLTVLGGAPGITTQPASVVRCESSPAAVTFSVVATRSPTYQWRRDTVNIPGANSASYTIAAPVSSDTSVYDCVLTNLCGTTTTGGASILFDTPGIVITANPEPVTGCSLSGSVTFTVGATGSGLTYRWQRGTTNLSDNSDYSGTTTATLTITTPGTGLAGDFRCVVSNACGSVTTAAAALTVVSGTPTALQPPTGGTVCEGESFTFTAAATGASSYRWQRNGNNIPGATSAIYTIPSAAAANTGSYRYIATNACGSVNSVSTTLTVLRAPVFTTQPTDRSICVGSSFTLTAVASGSTSVSYQWRKDGVVLDGEIAAGLTRSAASSGDAGVYDCIATSACGSVTSNPATLTIIPPPVITAQPQSAQTCLSTPAVFTISILEGPAPTFRWQWRPTGAAEWSDLASGTNSYTGTPRVSASGVDTPVLSLMTLAGPGSTADVRCIVSVSSCATPSASAALTVCAGDYNCSGTVSVQDIFDFLAGYFAGAPAADINNSGAISVQDIFDFLTFYFAGCP